jgi:subtilase family serine protease
MSIQIRPRKPPGLAFALAGVAAAIVAALPRFAGAGRNAPDVALRGNHPILSAEAGLVQPLNPGQLLQLRLSFAPRGRARLTRYLKTIQDPASPNYHRWLTAGQYARRFGRTPAEVAAVAAWLTRAGLRVSARSPTGITATGAAAMVERAFATRLAANANGGVYANLSDPKIPARFARIISSIAGLDNTLHAVPMDSAAGAGRAPGALGRTFAMAAAPEYAGAEGEAFGPQDLWTFYDETPLVQDALDGAGQCVAIVEDSDLLTSAVTLFDSTFALPDPSLTRVLADGVNPGRTTDETEALLDVEWAHAVATGAAVVVYIGAGANGLVDALSAAVTDNQCGAISVSYSFCGGPASFYTGTLDPLLAQAAAQGQSVAVAAGDDGSAGLTLNSAGTACVVGTSLNVSEFAADPNVIAVGGSQFTPVYNASGDDVGYVAESVWDDATGAGGGGASSIFAKPSYQIGLTPPDSMRDLPDVVMGASPLAPGFYWGDDPNQAGVAQMNCCIGGTSIAAPILAGLMNVVAQSAGGRAGNPNPRIYQLGALHDTSSSGLRDIASGNNGFNGVSGFVAEPGYDQASGWGSIDMATFVAAFAPASPTPTPSASPSPTPSPTPTSSATPSPSPTVSPTPTPTATPTPTPSATPTPSPTPTPSATPSSSPTPTASPTPPQPAADAIVTPRVLNFGPIKMGTASAVQIVTVLNPADSPAPLAIARIIRQGGAAFALVPSPWSCAAATILAAGQSCAIAISFAPAAPGLRGGALAIIDNARNAPQRIYFYGAGF